MRITVGRMAKRPWAVRDLKLTLCGIDRAASASSNGGITNGMATFASAFLDLDRAAASLFPQAHAQGRLLKTAQAAQEFGGKLRHFSETVFSEGTVDPQRLFADMLNDDRAKRPPNPSLLTSDECDHSTCEDGVEVMFESFEVDADNYEEVRYGGNYGPCDRPSVQASSDGSTTSTWGQAEASGDLRPFSLHLCIDPTPRPSKFPLRLECRMVLLPAGWAHAVSTSEDLNAVPHLLLEGNVKPFEFDQPLHLMATQLSGLGPKMGLGFSAGCE